MNIILVSPSLDPNISLGGISAVANFIVKNNRDVNYLLFEQGKRDAAKGGYRRVFELIANFKKWFAILDNYPDAIIHYNFPLSPAAIIRDYVFMKVAMTRKRKMIVHVHGGLYMNQDRMPWLIKRILQEIFGWKIPFVVLGEKEKKKIQSRYNTSEIVVLPNCVDVDIRYKKKYSEECMNLGYIGRITSEKGMRELIEACKELKNLNVCFNLSVAGAEDSSTNYVDSFKELLGDRFTYVGIVSGEEKIRFISNLDIFILPSYFEGLPLSLLECMSYSVVPISTKVGSIPELITDNKNGILIETKKSKPIVEAVLGLCKDRIKLEKMGEEARKKVVEKYNPQDYITTLNSLYSTLELKY